ncbi:hypothetical protein KHQ06_33435 [Nocardia tengchongensis]|uniref:Uncharacterized protein n=1 Tax=Nocardia tengchongensis TaxID=2055889 RepID=A0ABX8CM04_9NOCA|nr:hypothetical protein [Nocardia tengchongensis]QVI20930.1 hypothetical protein KHQ06_33435 [Nocardia tengchongensis]
MGVMVAARPRPAFRASKCRNCRVSSVDSDLLVVEIETLRDDWSATWKHAADDKFVQVNRNGTVPTAMMLSPGMWRERHKANKDLAVPEANVRELTSTDARINVAEIIKDLDAGIHTAIMFRGAQRAVFAPYEWVRIAFPALGLTPLDDLVADLAASAHNVGPHVMVVYRKSRTQRALLKEFAHAPDPVWEADRRLSSLRGPVPSWRRASLRAVVYVVDGQVARVRALDSAAAWEDLPGVFSLAPVSDLLSRSEIDERFPSLKLYPGDNRPAVAGSSREYVDLHPTSAG